MLHLGLPEGVEQLIHEFASGWQPTPSAAALQKVRRDGGFFDARARARCQDCDATICGARWWQVHGDGAVYMLYNTLDGYCEDCRDWEDGVEEVEVCQTLSRKTTWETCWENATEEFYHALQENKVRAWVRERLRAVNTEGR